MDQKKASAIASWDGVPHISPSACIRDSVADDLFDDVWREVVSLLEELLRKHWEKEHSGGFTQFKLAEMFTFASGIHSFSINFREYSEGNP